MTVAEATFSTSPYNRQLTICTHGSSLQVDICPDMAMAKAYCSQMEKAIYRALASGEEYPEDFGANLHHNLGWRSGLEHLIHCNPEKIVFTLSDQTCMLIPELASVDWLGKTTWLDTIAPIYRTLGEIGQPTVRHLRNQSLAIICQESTEPIDFRKVGQSLMLDLSNLGIDADLYLGTDFPLQPEGMYRTLNKVFYGHRAVLFIGHLDRDQEGKWGWQLSDRSNHILTMALLQNYLNLSKRTRSHRPSTHGGTSRVAAHFMPEVVFVNSCRGASSEPDLLYPKVFLQAGVRFFIGTWMDIVFNPKQRAETEALMSALIRDFFQRWFADPENAVEHLYAVKKANNFHLLTSLYQIYTAGGEQALVPGGREPLGAIVSGLKSDLKKDDLLGEYKLMQEMWADCYGRTFLVENQRTASLHLLQVLADQWQNTPEIGPKLDAAIAELSQAELGPDHLIPKAHAELVLKRDGAELRLHVLRYDWPAGAVIENWRTLDRESFDLEAPEHFTKVLRLGARASYALAFLHSNKMEHGNLDPNSIVVIRESNDFRIMIKDAWVQRSFPGRRVDRRYAAPVDETPEEPGGQLKADCWGLGVILYEKAAGRSPFPEPEAAYHGPALPLKEALGPAAARVPDALERVVRECLMADSRLRPTAEFIARRLALALGAGGTYISDFEQDLIHRIQAGHRLFAVLHENSGELEEILKGLDSKQFSAYSTAEEQGLVDIQRQQTEVAWQNAQQLAPIYPNLAPLSHQSVSEINSAYMFGWFFNLPAGPPNPRPILLIRGTQWWAVNPVILRILKLLQASPESSPVLIFIHDHPLDLMVLNRLLGRACVMLRFPPPSPAALFERILEFAGKETGDPEALTPQAAIDLALHFFPSPMREVKESLRMCFFKHGAIDARALDIRNEFMERRFKAAGTVSYTPAAKLPDPGWIGLPEQLERVLTDWIGTLTALEEQAAPWHHLPRRLLVSGPDGCGKTSLARTLAARIGFPLVSLNAARCLRGGLGESERLLRATLEILGLDSSLHRTVVLFDDVDKFFEEPQPGNSAGTVAATLGRMAAIVLEWLDALPTRVIAVITAAQPQRLPARWRRRFEMMMDLPQPDSPGSYRTAVFQALFRRFNLPSLARDSDFMTEMAGRTAPAGDSGRVASPLARRVSASSPLSDLTLRLATSADIEHWIQETLLYHGSESSPESIQFWQMALSGERNGSYGKIAAR